MALPTIQPYWMKSYRTPMELSHRRLEKQADLNSFWNQSQKFFREGEILARKSNCWTSDLAVKRSMDAVDKLLSGIEEKDKQTSISLRRAKLQELLSNEKKQYEKEMQKLRCSVDTPLSVLQRRVDNMQGEKEERRKKEAEQKLYEHWRQNEPRLREIESEKRSSHVVRSWQGQVEEKAEVAKTAREEKIRHEEELHEKHKKGLELDRLLEEENRLQRKQNAADLQKQMGELKRREEEAETLRIEEERLIEHEKLLAEAEEKRKLLEEQRKKHELGRVLIRQYKHQLKKRSIEVQQGLRNDMQLLQEIAKKEKEELELQSARKEKQKADAEFMLKVVADQLQLEKYREADLDALYQEEASRQWQKREAEWERERLAREKLMKSVFEERQEQINMKRKMLQEQQEESIKEREKLLEAVEEYQQLTHREEEDKLTARKNREIEIKEQIYDIESQREKSRREEKEELERERIEKEKYEALIAKEADRLDQYEEPPSSYRRKKVAFM